jgi:acyl carrier protein
MDIIQKLREILVPIFGLDSIDEVQPEHSLVEDIGADSLDFVEIIYQIEQTFDVILKINEIFIGGKPIDPDQLFEDGKLTKKSAEMLKDSFPDNANRIEEGLTKADFLSMLTVKDLARIIELKM